jgi:hypothetical protein
MRVMVLAMALLLSSQAMALNRCHYNLALAVGVAGLAVFKPDQWTIGATALAVVALVICEIPSDVAGTIYQDPAEGYKQFKAFRALVKAVGYDLALEAMLMRAKGRSEEDILRYLATQINAPTA